MNARIGGDALIAALDLGEISGARVSPPSWRNNPFTDMPSRAEWLKGWIRGFFGGATGRRFGKSVELKDKYLAVFHEKRPAGALRRPYCHFSAEDWELVEIARALTPPLKWPVIAAMIGHPSESLRQRAQQKHIGVKRRAA